MPPNAPEAIPGRPYFLNNRGQIATGLMQFLRSVGNSESCGFLGLVQNATVVARPVSLRR